MTRVKHLEDMVTGVEGRVSQGITTLETTLLSSFQSGLDDISNKIKDQYASLLSTMDTNNAAEADIKNCNNNNENKNNNKDKMGVLYVNAAAQTDAYGLGASNGMVLAATAATLHSHHTIDQLSPSSIVASHNGTAAGTGTGTGTGTDEKKKEETEGDTGDGGDYGHGGKGGGVGLFGDLESLFDNEVQGGRGGGRGKRRRDKNVAAKEDVQQDDDKEMEEMERRVKAKLAKHHRQLAKKQQ